MCAAEARQEKSMRDGTVEPPQCARHSEDVARTHTPVQTRTRKVPNARVDRRALVGIDPLIEPDGDLREESLQEKSADETGAIRDAVGLAGGAACQEKARRFNGSHRQHGDSGSRPVEAVRAAVEDTRDSSIVAHFQCEHSGSSFDLEPARPFGPPNRRQIDAGLGAEDAALGASPTPLAGSPPVNTAGWKRQ